MAKNIHLILLIGGFIFLTACTPKAEEIRFGEDGCSYCRMIISDPKFGAELVTDKGKVYKFDATECMANYLEEADLENQKFAFVLAIGYDTPGVLHDVSNLHFLISPNLPSPMGAYLSAFMDDNRAQEAQIEYDGEIKSWTNVRNSIRKMSSN